MVIMLKYLHISTGRKMTQTKPFPLRMPDDMRSYLQESADNMGRSLNAEIIHRIQCSIESDISKSGDHISHLYPKNYNSGAGSSLPPNMIILSDEAHKAHAMYLNEDISDVVRFVREEMKKKKGDNKGV